MQRIFLNLLKDIKLNQKSEACECNFLSLYELSKNHQIIPLMYNQIYHFENFPIELKNQWKKDAFRLNAMQTMKTERFLRLYQQFNYQVIVVKGLICRNLYSNPDLRTSNDEDLYVKKEHFENTKETLLNNGFILVEESEDVSTFVCRQTGLSIELHTALFSEESKAYGNYQQHFTNVFDRAIIHEIQGVKVYSLHPTDHLLFLMTHFVKHFLHGGVGIRQMLDMVLYIEKYTKQINWYDLYNILKELNIYTFILNIINISIKELGMIHNILPFPIDYYEHLEKNYEDLLSDIIDAGVFGKSSMERLHSSTMTLNATESGKSNVLKSIFPTRKELQGRYPYLKKSALLLPVAWASRIYHYMTDKDNGDSQKTIEIGNQRIELLKKYKIIK